MYISCYFCWFYCHFWGDLTLRPIERTSRIWDQFESLARGPMTGMSGWGSMAGRPGLGLYGWGPPIVECMYVHVVATFWYGYFIFFIVPA